MNARILASHLLFVVLAAMSGTGCQASGTAQVQMSSTASAQAQTTVASMSAMQRFEDAATGVHFHYPDRWVASASNEFVLLLLPASHAPRCRIVFDIPQLPLHIPGTIWLGLVQHQYINRLKEKHPDVHVERTADRVVSLGVKERLVECSCTEEGKAHQIIGLLSVREDRVFILSAGSDPGDFSAVRKDFDEITGTIGWSK